MVYYDINFYERFSKDIDGFTGEGGVYAPSACLEQEHNDTTTFLNKVDIPTMDFKNKGYFAYNNCGTFAISIAISLGFKDIYLLGMDCRFSEDKTKTHYHNYYDNAGKKEHMLDHMIDGFRGWGRYVRDNDADVHLYNCSPISIIDPLEVYGYKNINVKDIL